MQADQCYLVLGQARESLIELAGLPVQQNARRKARAFANFLEKLQARLLNLSVASAQTLPEMPWLRSGPSPSGKVKRPARGPQAASDPQ